MTTIWKFPLEVTDSQHIALPSMYTPLSVQVQDGRLTLWAMVDPGTSTVTREIRIIGTGHPIHEFPGFYIGTAQLDGFVWHVFIRQ